ncbi:MAG: hypothetical protein A3I61_19380 [Acidobacteria bacterium RIFCSPLOWO2_02_FULL_68_18]|nr:MAG: hypothetical protein A3I61_19380 [Acidobacteria bacterium RIFCSPLOWO2_02_FULL_68_18]OFW49729.1 MAG: hypothetical protein A3G77_06490 [Acidobacteria bacterium RIFCSPLOWO2_12_FULL_68_19]
MPRMAPSSAAVSGMLRTTGRWRLGLALIVADGCRLDARVRRLLSLADAGEEAADLVCEGLG